MTSDTVRYQENEIRQLLSNSVTLAKDMAEVPSDVPLSTVGLNSIKFIKFLIEFEKRYSFLVPEEEMVIENFESIEKIAQYLAKKVV